MLVPGLLNEIGFSEAEQAQYFAYREKIGNVVGKYAQAFMEGDITFQQALAELEESQTSDLHKYTVHLLFILECTGFLLARYEKEGISKELFVNSMRDIKYKLDECIRAKNIFGTFVVEWFEGFFRLTRIAFGRLQYDITTCDKELVTVKDYAINSGDFILNCHIPSAGPLKPELCLESFNLAHAFFKEKLKNGILPIRCNSWLLYPPYMQVFGEKSNTADFAKNFEIVDVQAREQFNDAWRVFGVDFDGNANKLSADTTMQKKFIEYIKNGGSFGVAAGILLFDGEKVLTRK